MEEKSIKDKIFKEYDKGSILFNSIEGICIAKLDDFISQPEEGMLYKEAIAFNNLKKQYNSSFEEELTTLINKHSKENDSNTPDWLLAKYLNECLEVFNNNIKRRESYYKG